MAFQTAFIGSASIPLNASRSTNSSFVCTNPIATAATTTQLPRAQRAVSKSSATQIHMGKVAKFGIFSPAVIAVRFVIGEKRFDKIRGKGISLHSEVITNFCEFVGTSPKTKQGLIRLAKNNGSTLGFLS